ncbi:uncharacterized protein LOC130931462 isoform X2 [Corythoichthys intestinalis]|nr:uncharacterized protein LOC130931462 isoform X2 [Corythoichthys intestinalis]
MPVSDAVNSLDALHKRRYVEKLQLIHSPDPYFMPKSMFFDPLSSPSLPDICYPDIYNYLVHTKSAYSHESLKNFKSLEAYKYFVAGWVKQVLVHENSAGIYLVLEKITPQWTNTGTARRNVNSNQSIQLCSASSHGDQGQLDSFHLLSLLWKTPKFQEQRRRIMASTVIPCQVFESIIEDDKTNLYPVFVIQLEASDAVQYTDCIVGHLHFQIHHCDDCWDVLSYNHLFKR